MQIDSFDIKTPIMEMAQKAVDEVIENRKNELSNNTKLDNAITNVAYILDSLVALRTIYETGSCNTCCKKKKCDYAPDWGHITRFNCPFYKGDNDE